MNREAQAPNLEDMESTGVHEIKPTTPEELEQLEEKDAPIVSAEKVEVGVVKGEDLEKKSGKEKTKYFKEDYDEALDFFVKNDRALLEGLNIKGFVLGKSAIENVSAKVEQYLESLKYHNKKRRAKRGEEIEENQDMEKLFFQYEIALSHALEEKLKPSEAIAELIVDEIANEIEATSKDKLSREDLHEAIVERLSRDQRNLRENQAQKETKEAVKRTEFYTDTAKVVFKDKLVELLVPRSEEAQSLENILSETGVSRETYSQFHKYITTNIDSLSNRLAQDYWSDRKTELEQQGVDLTDKSFKDQFKEDIKDDPAVYELIFKDIKENLRAVRRDPYKEEYREFARASVMNTPDVVEDFLENYKPAKGQEKRFQELEGKFTLSQLSDEERGELGDHFLTYLENKSKARAA